LWQSLFLPWNRKIRRFTNHRGRSIKDKTKEAGRKEFTHDPYRIVAIDGEIKWLDDITFIRRNKFTILGVEVPVRQGAKTQEYRDIPSFRNAAGRDTSAYKIWSYFWVSPKGVWWYNHRWICSSGSVRRWVGNIIRWPWEGIWNVQNPALNCVHNSKCSGNFTIYWENWRTDLRLAEQICIESVNWSDLTWARSIAKILAEKKCVFVIV